MQRSTVNRLILPATAVSICIFAGCLTVMTLQKSAMVGVDQVTSETGETRPYPTYERRSLAIQQVGLAVILAASSGFITVELLRKWWAFRHLGESKLKQLGIAEFMMASRSAADPAPTDDTFEMPVSELEAADAWIADAAARAADRHS
jgi:hypothetical protein